MKSVKYLEELRAQLGDVTNQKLADELGLTQGAVSHYSNGRRVMDDDTCLKIAILLKINPLEIVAAAKVDSAEKAGKQSPWAQFLANSAAIAASTVLAAGVTLFLTPDLAHAASMRVAEEVSGGNINYA